MHRVGSKIARKERRTAIAMRDILDVKHLGLRFGCRVTVGCTGTTAQSIDLPEPGTKRKVTVPEAEPAIPTAGG